MKVFLTVIVACAIPAGACAGPEKADLWSLAPVGHLQVPPLSGDWQRNAVDVLSDGRPAPGASRRALIRRASYDLTGLPPSPAAVGRFVADPRDAPAAFAAVVEQLLASPHYGEHWGRRWLDVPRYADTAGETAIIPCSTRGATETG